MPVPVFIIDAEVKKDSGGDGPGAAAYAAALRSPQQWMPALGEVFVENMEQRFQTQTDPWGNAWAPLSPVTIKLRAAKGTLGKILQVTRNLANSKFWRVEGETILVGLGAIYARAQQFGNPQNKMYGKAPAPIPARPILPLRDGGRVDLPRPLLDELRETARDALRRFAERARSA